MSNLQIAEVLEKALGKFGPNGEHWGKFPDCPEDHTCAILAIPDDSEFSREAIDILKKAAGVRFLTKWNDAPERTWPEVKAAYEKAIKLAKERP